MDALSKKQAALKEVEDELQGLQDQFEAANKKKEVCVVLHCLFPSFFRLIWICS